MVVNNALPLKAARATVSLLIFDVVLISLLYRSRLTNLFLSFVYTLFRTECQKNLCQVVRVEWMKCAYVGKDVGQSSLVTASVLDFR